MDGTRATKRLKSDHDNAQRNHQDGQPQVTQTTIFISNLHCPSCVNAIEEALSVISPKPLEVSTSIVSHSISVSHSLELSVHTIIQALDESGFDIHSAFGQDSAKDPHQILPATSSSDSWEDSLELAVRRWRQSWWHAKGKGKEPEDSTEAMEKRAKHTEQCPECRNELQARDSAAHGLLQESSHDADLTSLYNGKTRDIVDANTVSSSVSSNEEKIEVVIADVGRNDTYQAELAITGMTCSSCVGSITSAVESLPWVRSVNVALLTNSAVIVFEGKDRSNELIEAIEDAGFDVSLESLNRVFDQKEEEEKKKKKSERQSQISTDQWKATYSIGGMTCSACVGSITNAIKQREWVESVDINLISNSGTVLFSGRDHLAALTEAIEDVGFEATLDNVIEVTTDDLEQVIDRVVIIRMRGMYCHHCPVKILGLLEQKWPGVLQIERSPTLEDPFLQIRYIANLPHLSIRTILDELNNLDPVFEPAIYHPPTIEDKSRELHRRERRRVLFRLALSVTAAVPAFIIGIVCMSLLSKDSPARRYVMEPMWSGTVSRAEWALFVIATPVYFFAADTFHLKALKELRSLWRPGSRTPVWQRFTRFGSMNMLMSLGTTIAYFSSIAELIMAGTEKPSQDMDYDSANNSFYFDSVIFLTMFLLFGRFLEAYSKARTGDAVDQLGKLRPVDALLLDTKAGSSQTVSVDLLEVGDVVRVAHGQSPPFDGVVVEGGTSFDESSLTGESRLVSKATGDAVYSGTVNKGGPISVCLSSISGTSMLDQIIKVVREGQTRRAPVERAADMITSHFVPFVVAIGILTWVVWLTLGESGALPSSWLDVAMGGWALWSLRFAIAVFVVACPCGIGLAAPTALFVGGGMAAKHGILVKGGGEAFQEASTLDYVVFDKTGTLTGGGEPKVTDWQRCSDDAEAEVLGMVMALEQQSGHPVARAIVALCNERRANPLVATSVEELPGRGIQGSFHLDATKEQNITIDTLIGNERLMVENDVDIKPALWSTLQTWKRQGKSVVLVALRARTGAVEGQTGSEVSQPEPQWALSAILAVADALRPEATATVAALLSRDIGVWMLSGDNPTTAQAVAAQVGIPPENVIAGVLPDQKAEKVQYLQKSLPYKGRGKKHATVAMVGDGINDSPALTVADVGIAIGSGSDVAISSADFILISSDLSSLLTLVDLSRVVFRRVWFNFGWALIYNLIAVPIAAGMLYPIKTNNGGHVRLDPVWASLAMALSSVSVVSSSLLLRTKLPLVGFRERVRSESDR